MRTLDAKKIAAFKAQYEKTGYVKKVWKTSEDWTITLEEYAEYVNPIFKDLKTAEIIEKEYKDKDGKEKSFLKINFIFEGGTEVEWDLPYDEKDENNECIFPDFEEGDELDLSTIKFCTQMCMKESHKYAVGEIK